ncbi:hypothetical protein [uncultured Sphingomonas sp.]|uniref:hypothetical protein n=1 Tax=uncultured Sphingomonas sp. TaxID=158754 RepID=UPI0025F8B753|nr:hypothetical protein [uncultured Sphingomonas sp.]
MPASADILPPAPADADRDTPRTAPPPGTPGTTPALAAGRHDGWTPARQEQFLRMLAEGHSVTNSCAALGMSVTSAYVLRRSARGAAFALGWQAALLLARERLADALLERALHGTVETITRPDGATLTRERHDNRLAMQLLARLDRLAESATGPADHAAARLVAAEFEPFLDVIARDGGAARAGLFLARRSADEDAADELGAIRALARADAWLRTRDAAGAGQSVADLDPAQRADWTADQWARAEAAGLVALAPPPPPPDPVQAPKLRELRHPDNPDGDPVWWSSTHDAWRTSFPPPDGFCGEEAGEYGTPHYARELSPEEAEVLDAPRRAALAARRAEAAQARDAFFADTFEVVDVYGDADDLDPAEVAAVAGGDGRGAIGWTAAIRGPADPGRSLPAAAVAGVSSDGGPRGVRRTPRSAPARSAGRTARGGGGGSAAAGGPAS